MTTEEQRRQEFIDKVVPLVVKQGRQSDGDDGRCLYRGPNGLRCAIGFAIPDDRYTPDMEIGLCASEVLRSWPGAVEGLDATDAGFADSLQLAHDNAIYQETFVTHFLAAVRVLAIRYGLTAPQIEENQK